jgi:hypothetical protein
VLLRASVGAPLNANYEAICKARKITLEEFFRANPAEYQRYKKLSTSRNY